MKMEFRIEGKLVIIEAEGNISLKILDEEVSVPAPAVPQPALYVLPPAVASPVNPGLFGKLSALRKQLAGEQKVPPYVIFNDKTLLEMAEKCPQDLAAFSKIPGVGQAKLEKYGELFLSVLHEGVAV